MKERNTLNKSQALLSYEQVLRLLEIMNEEIEVHGRGNFPPLQITLRSLIKRVQFRLSERGLKTKQVKMNGGFASHVLASRDLPYSDIDLIFGGVDLSVAKNFELVKEAVLEALIDLLPAGTNKSKISPSAMKDAYVKKMVKVCDGDLWSLISLNNDRGRFIELKFVDRMRRQYEFSVDSFQIHLDSLVAFDEQQPTTPARVRSDKQRRDSQPEPERMRLNPNCFPSVLTESVYGNFRAALKHLNDMLIDTEMPELIRGGGLLKYCQLLARGYRPARPQQCRVLERYMCSRFFIDFPSVVEQERKLRSYMENHFQGDNEAKYEYLQLLYRVIDESTVCLMNHERRLTLSMVNRLAYDVSVQVYYDQQRQKALAAARVYAVHSPSAEKPASSSSSCVCCCSRCSTPVIALEELARGQQQHRKSSAAPSTVSVSTVASTASSSSTPTSISGGEVKCEERCEQTGQGTGSFSCCEQCQQHQPRQTLLYVPHNASHWIAVM